VRNRAVPLAAEKSHCLMFNGKNLQSSYRLDHTSVRLRASRLEARIAAFPC